MLMLPKQLLHTVLHPRALNTLSPSFETSGLECWQQRNRSQSPHMLVLSSPFFETKGLELAQQTNRSQSLHTPVSCCMPSQHDKYSASKLHPFSHLAPHNSPTHSPSPPHIARVRVQTRLRPKLLCVWGQGGSIGTTLKSGSNNMTTFCESLSGVQNSSHSHPRAHCIRRSVQTARADQRHWSVGTICTGLRP